MEERLCAPGERLAACGAFIRPGSTVADIGTDHAYLPIWLVQNGVCPRVFASDVNEMPIQLARSHIAQYGLDDRIITLTADGLEQIPQDEVDDIVMAGMGGDNMIHILDAAPWLQNVRYRLILQPMSRTERVREYLYRHHFAIRAERAICESKRIYTIICAEYSTQPLDYGALDIYTGGLQPDDANAVKLMRKQADILCAEAAGWRAQGDPQRAAEREQLADRLLRYAKGE